MTQHTCLAIVTFIPAAKPIASTTEPLIWAISTFTLIPPFISLVYHSTLKIFTIDVKIYPSQ